MLKTAQSAAPVRRYFWMLFTVAAFACLSYGLAPAILAHLAALEDAPTAPVLATLLLFAVCSFASFYATRDTAVPSFVAAIALGIAGHGFFEPIVRDRQLLASLVTGSAALILFGGGLEMPFRNFVRLLPKIVLLAFPGVIITGFGLSAVLSGAGAVLHLPLASTVVILLGAILASTDPAAIIPALESLRFRRSDPKEIVVAESALNDVVGTLLTSAFLKLSLTSLSLGGAYLALAGMSTARFLVQQIVLGALFGVGGYLLLHLLSFVKRRHSNSFPADQVYFLAIPILSFIGAVALGGSGFLAAFIAGLLFHVEEHLKDVERFYSQVIDGVAKPIIFLLVGAMVDVQSLLAYAPVGIIAALVFMFVLRPAMVFLMIGPFGLMAKDKGGLTLQELLFISFVRETGAIPAVLLVSALAMITGPANGLVEVGMWVILLTLVVGPPLTPLVARKLRVAT